MESTRKMRNADETMNKAAAENHAIEEKARKESSSVTAAHHSKHIGKSPAVPQSLRQTAGVCCGELFVTNNACRWTFFCTFCNKSTRDIGEFICHIKSRHLAPSTSNCNDDIGDYNDVTQDDENVENDQSTSFDNSYLDYGNFLDVNVHTESEDISFNGQEKNKAKRSYNFQSKPLPSQKQNFAIKRKRLPEANERNSTPTNKRDRHDNNTSASSKAAAVHNIDSNGSSSRYTRNPLKCEPSGSEDFEELIPMAPEQYNDTDKDIYEEDDEDDENQDYDNKLLIALADSLDNMPPDGSSEKVKEKRRQIRGTAYCELCDKTFQYYSLYRNHMIKHSNETPFKCTLCNKGFKSKQAIRYHINTHAKEKLYKCEICQASYNAENQFITHVLTHEDEKTFPCIVCGKIMDSEDARYQHLTEHTEERPFRCEFCNKLFRLRHHLSNHLKMHKQYRCDFCKCDFTSNTQLRKPYTCTECQKIDPDSRVKLEDSNSVHPLELYDSEQLTQPPIECVNVAEIITDSDVEDAKRKRARNNGQEDEEDNDDDMDEEDDDGDGDGDGVNDDDDDEDDDDDDYENEIREEKRCTCKECGRSYATLSGLNFHIRHKHSSSRT